MRFTIYQRKIGGIYNGSLCGSLCISQTGAQSVAGAFADLTGTAPEQLMAAMGGFGGGVGGSHEELCGAVSGGVLVLSLLHPHTD